MKTDVEVKIRLSEMGQRNALLEGKNASENQKIIFSDVEIDKDNIGFFDINSAGGLSMDADSTDWIINDSGEKDYYGLAFDSVPGFDEVFSAIQKRYRQRDAYLSRQKEEKKQEEEKGKRREQEHQKRRNELLQIFRDKGLKGILGEFAFCDVYRKATEYNLPEVGEAFVLEKEEQQKREAQEQAKQEDTKREWIEQYGSSRLKKAYADEYPTQKAYVEERTAHEFGPDWKVDFNNKMEWGVKVFPSEPALDEAKILGKKGYEVLIVWLTKDEDLEEPREAIVVRKFLDKYDVVKK